MKKFKKSLFCFCIIIFSLMVITKENGSLDEFWNYNFARNIVNGNIPYLDFNMIIFPFFPNFIAIFLKIFGEELFVYRVLQIVIYTVILYFSFKILEKLNVNNKVKNYIILFFYLFLIIFYYTCEYNVFCLLLITVLINLELSENKKNDFLIGFLTGIIILSKQSVGISILFIILLKSIFIDRSFRKTILRSFGAGISGIALILYLYFNHCINEFLNYTIFGLNDFTKNHVSFIDLLLHGDYFISLIAIFMVFLYIFILFKLKSRIKDKTFLTLALYSIGNFTMIVPIVDEAHFLLANFTFIFVLFYLLKNENSISEETLKSFSKVLNFFNIILIVLFMFFFIYNFKYKDFKHYKNIPISNKNIEMLNEVTNFLNENPNTYILDATAAFYMIPAEKFNGKFDLSLIGNLGNDGENKLIDEIKNLENKYILINQNYKNWQNSIKAIEFVKKNYKLIGNISDFNIYFVERKNYD